MSIKIGVCPYFLSYLANLSFSTIASGIEGMINASGIFEDIYKSYKKNTLTVLDVAVEPKMPDIGDYRDALGILVEEAYDNAWLQYKKDLADYYWEKIKIAIFPVCLMTKYVLLQLLSRLNALYI